MVRRMFTTLAATGAVLALPATAAFAQSPQTYTANLSQANESGASGTVTIELDGTTADIRIDGRDFFDGFPHAIHFHGEPGGDNVCGPLNPGDPGFDEADEDGDGLISVVEGVPAYGPVTVSLTTEGDTSPDSALAVDRFPTSGTLDYQRTIELPQEVADHLSTLHVVVHAADLDDSGEIGDFGTPSSLDPELDIEATIPAACGQITASAAGGVATGAGGTATEGGGNGAAAALAGAAGLSAIGFAGLRRRRDEA
ncbi:hypothetical protein [Egicoccus sp. AB-alg2]|uniref:hypothetical protein n=1 Tax=Egicoccus sp. AB-alg2 TaxID=3242693 RepID=UPI00359E9CA9